MYRPKSFKKWVAAWTAALFLFSGNSAAFPMPAERSTPSQNLPWSGRSVLEGLPTWLGRVEEFHQSSQTAPLVVLIQDAHGLSDAQESIEKLILYFLDHGLENIAVEGATARLDPQFLRSFPYRKAVSGILNALMEKGEISGTVKAAVMGDKGIFEGIENEQLYFEGLKAYLGATSAQKSWLKTLEKERSQLAEKKQQIYSALLFEVDQLLEAGEEEGHRLLEVLGRLSEIQAPPPNSGLALLLELVRRQKVYEGPRFTQKVKALVREVNAQLKASTVSAAQWMRWNEMLQNFQSSKIEASGFLGDVHDFAGENRLSMAWDAELTQAVGLEGKIRALQGGRILQEFEDYGSSVKKRLMSRPEEMELDRMSRRLRLLMQLALLRLTRDEWDEMKDELAGDRRGKRYGDALRFYEMAEQREEFFIGKINKLISKARSAEPAKLVFVVGGFHTDGIKGRLRERQYSYAVVMPHMRSLGDENHYARLMAGDVSWKRYWQKENGEILLYDSFMRMMRDRLLESGGQERAEGERDRRALSKHWRDQILRDLSLKGRIHEAGEYTKYLDDAAEIQAAALRPPWFEKLARFLDGLEGLQAKQALTSPNILKLLERSGQKEMVTVGLLQPGLRFPLEALRNPKSEARLITTFKDIPSEVAEKTAGIYYGHPFRHEGEDLDPDEYGFHFLPESWVERVLPALPPWLRIEGDHVRLSDDASPFMKAFAHEHERKIVDNYRLLMAGVEQHVGRGVNLIFHEGAQEEVLEEYWNYYGGHLIQFPGIRPMDLSLATVEGKGEGKDATASVMGLRDRQGNIHLPVDLLLPGWSDPLNRDFAVQLILAIVTPPREVEEVLLKHTQAVIAHHFPAASLPQGLALEDEGQWPLLSLVDNYVGLTRRVANAIRAFAGGMFVENRKLPISLGIFAEALGELLYDRYAADTGLAILRMRALREFWFPKSVAGDLEDRFVAGEPARDYKVTEEELSQAIHRLFLSLAMGWEADTEGDWWAKEEDDFWDRTEAIEKWLGMPGNAKTHAEAFERLFGEKKVVLFEYADYEFHPDFIEGLVENIPPDTLLVFDNPWLHLGGWGYEVVPHDETAMQIEQFLKGEGPPPDYVRSRNGAEMHLSLRESIDAFNGHLKALSGRRIRIGFVPSFDWQGPQLQNVTDRNTLETEMRKYVHSLHDKFEQGRYRHLVMLRQIPHHLYMYQYWMQPDRQSPFLLKTLLEGKFGNKNVAMALSTVTYRSPWYDIARSLNFGEKRLAAFYGPGREGGLPEKTRDEKLRIGDLPILWGPNQVQTFDHYDAYFVVVTRPDEGGGRDKSKPNKSPTVSGIDPDSGKQPAGAGPRRRSGLVSGGPEGESTEQPVAPAQEDDAEPGRPLRVYTAGPALVQPRSEARSIGLLAEREGSKVPDPHGIYYGVGYFGNGHPHQFQGSPPGEEPDFHYLPADAIRGNQINPNNALAIDRKNPSARDQDSHVGKVLSKHEKAIARNYRKLLRAVRKAAGRKVGLVFHEGERSDRVSFLKHRLGSETLADFPQHQGFEPGIATLGSQGQGSVQSFIDDQGNIHLSVDFILPGWDESLRRLMAVQLVLATLEPSPAGRDLLVRNTRQAVMKSGLGGWWGGKIRSQLLGDNEPVPLLDFFGDYWSFRWELALRMAQYAPAFDRRGQMSVAMAVFAEQVPHLLGKRFGDKWQPAFERLRQERFFWFPKRVAMDLEDRFQFGRPRRNYGVRKKDFEAAIFNLFLFLAIGPQSPVPIQWRKGEPEVSDRRYSDAYWERVESAADWLKEPGHTQDQPAMLRDLFSSRKVVLVEYESEELDGEFLANLFGSIPNNTLLVFGNPWEYLKYFGVEVLPTREMRRTVEPYLRSRQGEPQYFGGNTRSTVIGQDGRLGVAHDPRVPWDRVGTFNTLLAGLANRGQGAHIGYFPPPAFDDPFEFEKITTAGGFRRWMKGYMRTLSERVVSGGYQHVVFLSQVPPRLTRHYAWMKPTREEDSYLKRLLVSTFGKNSVASVWSATSESEPWDSIFSLLPDGSRRSMAFYGPGRDNGFPDSLKAMPTRLTPNWRYRVGNHDVFFVSDTRPQSQQGAWPEQGATANGSAGNVGGVVWPNTGNNGGGNPTTPPWAENGGSGNASYAGGKGAHGNGDTGNNETGTGPHSDLSLPTPHRPREDARAYEDQSGAVHNWLADPNHRKGHEEVLDALYSDPKREVIVIEYGEDELRPDLLRTLLNVPENTLLVFGNPWDYLAAMGFDTVSIQELAAQVEALLSNRTEKLPEFVRLKNKTQHASEEAAHIKWFQRILASLAQRNRPSGYGENKKGENIGYFPLLDLSDAAAGEMEDRGALSKRLKDFTAALKEKFKAGGYERIIILWPVRSRQKQLASWLKPDRENDSLLKEILELRFGKKGQVATVYATTAVAQPWSDLTKDLVEDTEDTEDFAFFGPKVKGGLPPAIASLDPVAADGGSNYSLADFDAVLVASKEIPVISNPSRDEGDEGPAATGDSPSRRFSEAREGSAPKEGAAGKRPRRKSEARSGETGKAFKRFLKLLQDRRSLEAEFARHSALLARGFAVEEVRFPNDSRATFEIQIRVDKTKVEFERTVIYIHMDANNRDAIDRLEIKTPVAGYNTTLMHAFTMIFTELGFVSLRLKLFEQGSPAFFRQFFNGLLRGVKKKSELYKIFRRGHRKTGGSPHPVLLVKLRMLRRLLERRSMAERLLRWRYDKGSLKLGSDEFSAARLLARQMKEARDEAEPNARRRHYQIERDRFVRENKREPNASEMQKIEAAVRKQWKVKPTRRVTLIGVVSFSNLWHKQGIPSRVRMAVQPQSAPFVKIGESRSPQYRGVHHADIIRQGEFHESPTGYIRIVVHFESLPNNRNVLIPVEVHIVPQVKDERLGSNRANFLNAVQLLHDAFLSMGYSQRIAHSVPISMSVVKFLFKDAEINEIRRLMPSSSGEEVTLGGMMEIAGDPKTRARFFKSKSEARSNFRKDGEEWTEGSGGKGPSQRFLSETWYQRFRPQVHIPVGNWHIEAEGFHWDLDHSVRGFRGRERVKQVFHQAAFRASGSNHVSLLKAIEMLLLRHKPREIAEGWVSFLVEDAKRIARENGPSPFSIFAQQTVELLILKSGRISPLDGDTLWGLVVSGLIAAILEPIEFKTSPALPRALRAELVSKLTEKKALLKFLQIFLRTGPNRSKAAASEVTQALLSGLREGGYEEPLGVPHAFETLIQKMPGASAYFRWDRARQSLIFRHDIEKKLRYVDHPGRKLFVTALRDLAALGSTTSQLVLSSVLPHSGELAAILMGALDGAPLDQGLVLAQAMLTRGTGHYLDRAAKKRIVDWLLRQLRTVKDWARRRILLVLMAQTVTWGMPSDALARVTKEVGRPLASLSRQLKSLRELLHSTGRQRGDSMMVAGASYRRIRDLMEEAEIRLAILGGIAARAMADLSRKNADIAQRILRTLVEISGSENWDSDVRAEAASVLSRFVTMGHPDVLNFFIDALGLKANLQSELARLLGTDSISASIDEEGILSLLRTLGGLEDQTSRRAGFLILLRHQGRPGLLRRVVDEKDLAIDYRLYAAMHWLAHSSGREPEALRERIEHVIAGLGHAAREWISRLGGAEEWVHRLFQDPILQDEEAKVYLMGVWLTMENAFFESQDEGTGPRMRSGPVPEALVALSSTAGFLRTVRHIQRRTVIRPYYRQAHSSLVIGGSRFAAMRKDRGKRLIQSMAHELMHVILRSSYAYSSKGSGTNPHLARVWHEVLADAAGQLVLEETGLGEMYYRTRYLDAAGSPEVTGNGHRVLKPHLAARLMMLLTQRAARHVLSNGDSEDGESGVSGKRFLKEALHILRSRPLETSAFAPLYLHIFLKAALDGQNGEATSSSLASTHGATNGKVPLDDFIFEPLPPAAYVRIPRLQQLAARLRHATNGQPIKDATVGPAANSELRGADKAKELYAWLQEVGDPKKTPRWKAKRGVNPRQVQEQAAQDVDDLLNKLMQIAGRAVLGARVKPSWELLQKSEDVVDIRKSAEKMYPAEEVDEWVERLNLLGQVILGHRRSFYAKKEPETAQRFTIPKKVRLILGVIQHQILPRMRYLNHPWAKAMPLAGDWLAFQTTYGVEDGLYRRRHRELGLYADDYLMSVATRVGYNGAHLRRQYIDMADPIDFETMTPTLALLMKRFTKMTFAKTQKPPARRVRRLAAAILNFFHVTITADPQATINGYLTPQVFRRLERDHGIPLDRAKKILRMAFRRMRGKEQRNTYLHYRGSIFTIGNVVAVVKYNRQNPKKAISIHHVVTGSPRADDFYWHYFQKLQGHHDFLDEKYPEKVRALNRALKQFVGYAKPKPKSEARTLTREVIETRGRAARSWLETVVGKERQKALQWIRGLPEATFSEAYQAFMKEARTRHVKYRELIFRLSKKPTVNELRSIASFPGEVRIEHIRGTNIWLATLDSVGEEPVKNQYEYSDSNLLNRHALIDVAFHNHPWGRLDVPSMGDLAYALYHGGRSYLVTNKGFVRFNANRMLDHRGRLIFPDPLRMRDILSEIAEGLGYNPLQFSGWRTISEKEMILMLLEFYRKVRFDVGEPTTTVSLKSGRADRTLFDLLKNRSPRLRLRGLAQLGFIAFFLTDPKYSAKQRGEKMADLWLWMAKTDSAMRVRGFSMESLLNMARGYYPNVTALADQLPTESPFRAGFEDGSLVIRDRRQKSKGRNSVVPLGDGDPLRFAKELRKAATALGIGGRKHGLKLAIRARKKSASNPGGVWLRVSSSKKGPARSTPYLKLDFSPAQSFVREINAVLDSLTGPNPSSETRTLTMDVIRTRGRQAAISLRRILKNERADIVREVEQIQEASFQTAHENLLKEAPPSGGGQFRMYRLSKAPTSSQISKIADYPGEILILHVRGTRHWVMMNLDYGSHRIAPEAEPFHLYNRLQNFALVDVNFHNHPHGKLSVPSLGDIRFAALQGGRQYLVTLKGFVRYRVGRLRGPSGPYLFYPRKHELRHFAEELFGKEEARALHQLEIAPYYQKLMVLLRKAGVFIGEPRRSLNIEKLISRQPSAFRLLNSKRSRLRLRGLAQIMEMMDSVIPAHYRENDMGKKGADFLLRLARRDRSLRVRAFAYRKLLIRSYGGGYAWSLLEQLPVRGNIEAASMDQKIILRGRDGKQRVRFTFDGNSSQEWIERLMAAFKRLGVIGKKSRFKVSMEAKEHTVEIRIQTKKGSPEHVLPLFELDLKSRAGIPHQLNILLDIALPREAKSEIRFNPVVRRTAGELITFFRHPESLARHPEARRAEGSLRSFAEPALSRRSAQDDGEALRMTAARLPSDIAWSISFAGGVKKFNASVRSEAMAVLAEESRQSPHLDGARLAASEQTAMKLVRLMNQVWNRQGDGSLGFAIDAGPENRPVVEETLRHLPNGSFRIVFLPVAMGEVSAPGIERVYLRKVGNYRRMHRVRGVTIENNLLPYVTLGEIPQDVLRNDHLISVEVASDSLPAGLDPSHAQAVQLFAEALVGGLISRKVQSKSELRNPARRAAVQAELLGQLFQTNAYGQDAVVVGPHSVTIQGSFFRYLLESEARRQVSTAA